MIKHYTGIRLEAQLENHISNSAKKFPILQQALQDGGGESVMIKYHTGIRPEAQPENHLFFVIRKIEDGFFCKTVCHAINYLYKWLKGMQIWTKGEIFVKVE